MCNCANKRNQFTQSLSGNVLDEKVHSQMWPDVNFEYTGNSGCLLQVALQVKSTGLIIPVIYS